MKSLVLRSVFKYQMRKVTLSIILFLLASIFRLQPSVVPIIFCTYIILYYPEKDAYGVQQKLLSGCSPQLKRANNTDIGYCSAIIYMIV